MIKRLDRSIIATAIALFFALLTVLAPASGRALPLLAQEIDGPAAGQNLYLPLIMGGVQAPTAGLTIWADDFPRPILRAVAGRFTERYGVRIDVVAKPRAGIRDEFRFGAPVGNGPDILYGAHDWIGPFIAQGLLAPVSLGSRASSFQPAAVQAFTYADGKLYGMPQLVENVALYYNTDVVFLPPATWEEVATRSAELKNNGMPYGFLIQTGDPYHFYPIQTAFGGYVFGRNASGGYDVKDVGMNSPGSLAAFTWLNRMYEDGLLLRGIEVDSSQLLSAFMNGDAAMVISGPWALAQFREAGVPFAVAPIPAGAQLGRPFLGAQGFMVNALGKNKTLAQTFLQEFIATEATMRALYDADPSVSAWAPLAAEAPDEDLRAFWKAATTADPLPSIPEMSAVWVPWTRAMRSISDGDQTPQAALDRAQAEIKAGIGGGRQ